MSEILLRAEDARASANDMKKEAADATANFEALNGKLQSLADSFRGQTAVAFDERYKDWDKNAKGLIEALDGLGKFLEGAANAIEDVDTQLASQIKG
jgi:WXG100 family type VII secretion target